MIAGGLAGVLRPLIRSRRRAAAGGGVVGIPATLVFAPLVFGLAEACDPAGLASGVMTGAILGAFAGYKWFDESDIQRS